MRQLWCAVLLGVLALPAASAAAVAAMCFDHVGPQDKPMPAFCVCAPGAAAGGPAVRLDAAAWTALQSLAERQAQPEPGSPPVFGWYRLRQYPSLAVRYLSPGSMRQVTILLRSSPGLTPDQAELLRGLQARLD